MCLKRFIEREWLADIIKDEGITFCEEIMLGFWDIVAEYFTHK